MKVLIIEDEQPASKKLVRLLEDINPEIEIVDILRSVEQSTNWFFAHPDPDLIFMDIQLEDGISFEIFENCDIRTPIIFTTAYNEYAIKAFKVNSVDYLLKPISSDDLKKAISKFHTLHKPALESISKMLLPETKKRFLIKIGDHFKSISTDDIQCFYNKDRANFAFINGGKSYPIDYSLDRIEYMVDNKNFFRVNRNYIVRISAIKDIIIHSANRLKIVLEDGKYLDEIIVSRERVPGFKTWMDK